MKLVDFVCCEATIAELQQSDRDGVIAELVSALRLGRTTGLLTGIPFETMNEILICSRPAHLQKMAGSALKPRDRDIMRARFIRERLN